MSGPCGHFDFGEDTPWIGKLGFGIPALRYAELGFSVFPLVRGGKKPHRMLPLGDTAGVHHATRDQQQIQQWWISDPAANIGVATGRKSRLAVVDMDMKEVNGIETFHQFLSYWSLAWPLAPVALTPNGGQHYWLRWPEGSMPDRPFILPGVDVKGDGGYVVAAPSMLLFTPPDRPGERLPAGAQYAVPYSWRGCPCQAPDAPWWMTPWLSQAQAQGHPADPGSEAMTADLELGRLQEAGIPAGQRNVVSYRLACQRFRFHGTSRLGAERVLGELRTVWERSDRRGFTWREVMVLVESARKFIERQEQRERSAWQRFSPWLPR